MEDILEVQNLKKVYRQKKREVVAVEAVNFQLKKGECLGLVGESGCGKSTIAKLLTRLLEPDEGAIYLKGEPILGQKGKEWRNLYQEIQMIFQNPQDSFDPRKTLGHGMMESLLNYGWKKADAKQRLTELLAMVELEEELVNRFPHQVSGGQCQRAAIARALAISPSILICDEATSALDVTIQAQIVELLQRLQKELNLSILLICHDLALVQVMCDRVLVMQDGKIVETGTPDEVIQRLF